MIRALAIIACGFCALPANALDLTLPTNARQTVERVSALDTYQAPTGAFEGGEVPSLKVEGRIDRRVWRVDGKALTSLQIIDPLQDQLEAADFTTVFHCGANTCGGFDFRFAVEVMPTPNMFVDVRDYRFLTAVKGPQDSPDEVITLMVSQSGTSGYIQIIQAVARDALRRTPAGSEDGATRTEPTVRGDLASQLSDFGHVVLPDLKFETGSSELSAGDYPSLAALSQFLAANQGLKIALVGHTDSEGDLDVNIALSKRRAESVMDRLIGDFSIPAAQLQAEGMGYLAPIASNLTPDGRELNRRVEAIVISTE
jgi:OOP family OmpA-OmpF porin